MTLLNPILFASAAACVVLPVLIHLLMRRRRKPVPWGAMQFLLQAYRRQRRRMNLEQFLLLASRCLLVLLLALALGKPILGAAGIPGSRSQRTLFLLIDTSIASGAQQDSRSDLQRSIAAAEDLLSSLDPGQGDRAAVLTLGAPAQTLIWPPASDLTSVREALRELRPTDSRCDLAGALDTLRTELASNRQTGEIQLALLSGWREGSVDLASSLPALGRGVTLLAQPPENTEPDNVTVVDLHPLRRLLIADTESSPTVTDRYAVSLRRSGPASFAAGQTSVMLHVGAGPGSSVHTEDSVRWAAGQTAATLTLQLDVPAAEALRTPMTAWAELPPDALPADNIRRTPIEARDRLRLVVLTTTPVGTGATVDRYTPTDWLTLALGPDTDLLSRRRQAGDVRIETADPSRPASLGVLSDADAILIPQPDALDQAAWALVRGRVDQGALVVVFPPPSVQTHLWPDALAQGLGVELSLSREAKALTPPAHIAPPASSETLLEALAAELPDLLRPVTVSRVLAFQPSGRDTLLALDDATPILVALAPHPEAPSGRGLVILFTIPMDLAWTDLPTKPLMVPLMQELIRQGVGRALGNTTCDAGVAPLLPAGSTELARLGPGEGPASVAITQGRPAEPLRHAGTYAIRAASGLTTSLVALNPDLAGTRLAPSSTQDLERWLSALGSTPTWIGQELAGSGRPGAPATPPPLSVPLLIAALVLAAAEALLARVCSHASSLQGATA